MKSFLLLMISLCIVIVIHAQNETQTLFSIKPADTSIIPKTYPYKKFKWNDSLSDQLRKKLFGNEMPVAGSMRKGLVYLGNNQNGFDVYQTMQDNMYILKPDSTFESNMPVLKLSLEQKPVMDEKRN
jgi:hypothetical protein